MGNIKRKHTPAFKAKIALELIQGRAKVSEICSRYAIHPTQAGIWKEQAVKGLPSVYVSKADSLIKAKDELIAELYQQVGQLKVELDWLKKKVNSF